jgi:hypothetical protein
MPDKPQADIEWEARTLCPDGDCIGVIGPDRRCMECGRQYKGDLPENIETMVTPTDDAGDPEAEPDQGAESFDRADATSAEAPVSADDEWAARTLCEDENCIGVIGPEGRCTECGRSAKNS